MTSDIAQQHIACPNCPSSDAYCIYKDGHGYCYSCNYYRHPEHGEEIPSETFTFEYLPWRGVKKETFQLYDCKTKVDVDGRPISIGYKYPNGTFKVRKLNAKDFHWSPKGTNEAGLFGKDKFDSGVHKYVTITEGELDACSLYQVLRAPVVSVQSASSGWRDVASCIEWLSGFERIYLCFDNDAPGREAVERIAKQFDASKLYVVKLNKRKDANEYLQAGEGQELLNIWANAKKYLPESVTSSLQEFEELLKEKNKYGVAYPWPTLNAMTYGLRTGESVLLTAQEGVGKTTIMHAIEYQLLKETDDGVGAFYLEEPEKRHLQALAGLELRSPVHLPDNTCAPAAVAAALHHVVGRDDRLFLYSHFGGDDPDALCGTIRFLVTAHNVRWIMFDHIGMVFGASGAEDERRRLDAFSTKLETLVKELDFGLIFVSHVNDEGATRSSRWLGKIADIRIDATRNLISDDPVVKRTISLTVSKNRFCSHTGSAGKLLFNPNTYTYTEMSDAPANDNTPPFMQLAAA